MIDEAVFKTEWAILSERFGKKFSAPVTARYFQFLSSRLDTRQFRTACGHIFAGSQFFPSPEAFVKAVAGSDERQALDQWDLCMRIMYGERTILDRMNPVGRQAVALLGGVGRLGQTPIGSVPFVRRDFLKFYQEVADGEPQDLLPEVTAESREIVGEVKPKQIGAGDPLRRRYFWRVPGSYCVSRMVERGDIVTNRKHSWNRHHSGRFMLCRNCGVSRIIAERLGWTCGPVDLRAESFQKLSRCTACGMTTFEGEYHPFAACLMYRGSSNAADVRSNLQAVIEHGGKPAIVKVES